MHDLRNSAYKHISVHPEDCNLQVLHFCGRFFIETQLTFGSRSSPDRFDLISDLPLEFALLRSGLKRTSVIKQLDDVVCFGRRGTGTVGRFYKNYRDVRESVGVEVRVGVGVSGSAGASVASVAGAGVVSWSSGLLSLSLLIGLIQI